MIRTKIEILIFLTVLICIALAILGFSVAQTDTRPYFEATPRVEAYTAPEPCSLQVVQCPNEITARITEYGWTGYPMANGQYPFIGAVATSDRTIPLGTNVIIDGLEYVVADRTAAWVHTKFGMTTFDIYSENPQGKHIAEVIIK